MPKRVPDNLTLIHQHIGAKIRARRVVLGMSQQQLGTSLGLTFQQIQKYERGANALSSGRLYELAKILKVELTHFYEDLDQTKPTKSDKTVAIAARRETLELTRAYCDINSPTIRTMLRKLTAEIAGDPEANPHPAAAE